MFAPCISCISKYHRSPFNSCKTGNLSIITFGVPISSWHTNASNSASCLSLKASPLSPLSLLSFNLYYLMSGLFQGHIHMPCWFPTICRAVSRTLPLKLSSLINDFGTAPDMLCTSCHGLSFSKPPSCSHTVFSTNSFPST